MATKENITEPAEVVFTGRCQCGSVRYFSTSPPKNLTYCYCITCRRLSGSPFIAWADIPFSSFQLRPSSPSSPSAGSEEAGTDCALTPLSTSSFAIRSACKKCGSPITMMYYCDHGTIGVAAGTIDEGALPKQAMKVTDHIFVGQKPEWHQIAEDGVARFERFTDEFQGKIEEWEKAQA
ncbi:MAG: hypothetical protein Q9219_002875 [cf. Caloplaca sp. 3 TL-2023]